MSDEVDTTRRLRIHSVTSPPEESSVEAKAPKTAKRRSWDERDTFVGSPSDERPDGGSLGARSPLGGGPAEPLASNVTEIDTLLLNAHPVLAHGNLR